MTNTLAIINLARRYAKNNVAKNFPELSKAEAIAKAKAILPKFMPIALSSRADASIPNSHSARKSTTASMLRSAASTWERCAAWLYAEVWNQALSRRKALAVMPTRCLKKREK